MLRDYKEVEINRYLGNENWINIFPTICSHEMMVSECILANDHGIGEKGGCIVN